MVKKYYLGQLEETSSHSFALKKIIIKVKPRKWKAFVQPEQKNTYDSQGEFSSWLCCDVKFREFVSSVHVDTLNIFCKS